MAASPLRHPSQRQMHSSIAFAGQAHWPAVGTTRWDGTCPLNVYTPTPNTWFLGPTWVSPKRHLDRFSLFCTAHPCAQHADRHADHATCDICSNMPHLCTARIRCNCNFCSWTLLLSARSRVHSTPNSFPFSLKFFTVVATKRRRLAPTVETADHDKFLSTVPHER